MEDYLELFDSYMESSNMSPITIKQYHREIEIFMAFLKEKKVENIEDIKPMHIDLYQNKLMKKNVSSSVAKKIYTLKSFFKYLNTRGYIEKNPMDVIGGVKMKDADKKKKYNLTVEEAYKLIRKTEANSIPSMAKRNKILMMSFLFFGMRVSELCGLKTEHVSLKEKTVYIIDGKGGKNREVPMFEELMEDFKEYMKTRKGKEYFFSVKKTDKPLSPRSVLDLVKTHAKKANIDKNIGCHTLRRTAATFLLEDGLNPREIQKFLGHSSINTTMLYLNTDVEKTKEKIRKSYSLAKKIKKEKKKSKKEEKGKE